MRTREPLRRSRLSRSPLLLLALHAGACTVDNTAPGALRLRDLDWQDYACKVEPVVAARCSMTVCHGRADKAYRVYSSGKLRLGDASTLIARDAALRLAEAKANFASAKGMA